MYLTNETWAEKAKSFKRPLKRRKVCPTRVVDIQKDENGFQGLKVVPVKELELPLRLDKGEKILLDFGDHCVGYLNFAVNHVLGQAIVDSPIMLKFSFGEFPLEIVSDPADYKGGLGDGWFQTEVKHVVFTPYSCALERRYSFRYVLIERLGFAGNPLEITDIFADCVSAVNMEDAPAANNVDDRMKEIYEISLKTLKECEQDVFEDGPKRDRRLWIGDLRLQALTDYKTFKNYDLIKRCIYLFAAYRANNKQVVSCVFPDSYPYIDEWGFTDYSLFFISCLYDYFKHTDDVELVKELYSVALDQAELAMDGFNDEERAISGFAFIDWCPDLDKTVAILAVIVYTLKQLAELAKEIGQPTEWIEEQIERVSKAALTFYDEEKGLYVGATGQISWHSQVWVVLSGILSDDENVQLIKKTQDVSPDVTMHTPYMIHYYLDALYKCGLKDDLIAKIKEVWGGILDAGYDTCPEIFNPDNEFESPYGPAPEINSACHAWSCTPAYWIQLLNE